MNDRIDARDLAASHDVRIIDIRKAPDDRQIPGSEQFDGSKMESGEAIPFEKDERVVLYCGSGNSCTRIAGTLREQGYDVVALDGGYKAWQNAGLNTEPRP